MSNSREIKDTLQLRQLAAYHLITKQQTETLSREDEAMLNQYMGDPNVRGFVYEKIRNEARPEVSEMVDLYARSKGSVRSNRPTVIAKPPSRTLEDEVACIKIEASKGVDLYQEQEVKRIVDLYNTTKR